MNLNSLWSIIWRRKLKEQEKKAKEEEKEGIMVDDTRIAIETNIEGLVNHITVISRPIINSRMPASDFINYIYICFHSLSYARVLFK